MTAFGKAAREARLPLKTFSEAFPEACPYTREGMLTRPFAIDPDDTTA